jgi:aspartyl-tRNA(Asn)/glutamyl-tRNA(Gln) amidotransferase subunit C
MQLEDIKKLAIMARLDMSEAEMESLARDFDPILAYVGQVSGVADTGVIEPNYTVTNVMREDIATNATGSYRDTIVAQMPASHDGFLKVKKIL